jgi:hypothetical protein
VQGGTYNTLLRVLERWAWPTCTADSQLPLYVMNVAYPLVDAEVLRFCPGQARVLVVEEGQPNFIEQNIATILRPGGHAALHGKDCCRWPANTPRPRCCCAAWRFLQSLPAAAQLCRAAAPTLPPCRASGCAAPRGAVARRRRHQVQVARRRASAPAAPSGRSSPR